MNFIPFLLISLLCFYPAFSQPLKIDQKQMEVAQKLETKAIAANDSVLLAHAYFQYGHTHSFAGDNVQAKRYYIKALKILEKYPLSYDLGHIYVRLCEVLMITMEGRQDIDYLYKAIAIFKKINSPQGLAMAYGMLQGMYASRWAGNVKEGDARFDSLNTISNLQLKYARIAKDTSLIVDAYVRYGLTYTIVHNSPGALTYLKQALKVADVCKNDTIRIRVLQGFSDIYLTDNKPELARPYIAEVEAIYKRHNFQQFFILIHYLQNWREYYRQKGEWKQAYEQAHTVNLLINATDFANYDKTTTLMDQELETQKTTLILEAQKKEFALTTKLVDVQRRFIFITIALLIGTSVLSIFFFRLYRKFQRISKENAEISHRNEQLVREQNHRVKNNLQMVSSLLSMQARQLIDTDARQAILESKLRVQTMAIIQRKLYDSLHLTDIDLADFIPELADDVLAACGFSAIEKTFEIDPIILDVDRAIPMGLVITELIVNACKYAFPRNTAPRLTITCREKEGEITLLMADNGYDESFYNDENALALTQKEKPNSSSFGTQLIQLLAQQLYGIYQYIHEADGTRFTIKFNV